MQMISNTGEVPYCWDRALPAPPAAGAPGRTARAGGRGRGRRRRGTLQGPLTSPGRVSNRADFRPCPLNPDGASHWPGGSASGSGRGFHATPNERPRPHHAVRILLAFRPIGQLRRMRSPQHPRPRQSVLRTPAAGRWRRAPARQQLRIAGTGPGTDRRQRRCADRGRADPAPRDPSGEATPCGVFPSDLVRFCGPLRPVG